MVIEVLDSLLGQGDKYHPISMELRYRAAVRRHRIDAEEDSQHRIAIALLHISQSGCAVLYMPRIARSILPKKGQSKYPFETDIYSGPFFRVALVGSLSVIS